MDRAETLVLPVQGSSDGQWNEHGIHYQPTGEEKIKIVGAQQQKPDHGGVVCVMRNHRRKNPKTQKRPAQQNSYQSHFHAAYPCGFLRIAGVQKAPEESRDENSQPGNIGDRLPIPQFSLLK
jgi:hypothetical protein